MSSKFNITCQLISQTIHKDSAEQLYKQKGDLNGPKVDHLVLGSLLTFGFNTSRLSDYHCLSW